MADIYIARNDVLGTPQHHLYLVYDPNTDMDNDPTTNTTGVRIIRGGPDIGVNEIEIQADFREDRSEDALGSDDHLVDRYYTKLTMPAGVNAGDAWTTMKTYLQTLGSPSTDGNGDTTVDTELDYIGSVGPNSNAIVNSALSSVGISLAAQTPYIEGDDQNDRISTWNIIGEEHVLDGTGSDTFLISGDGSYTFHDNDGNDTIILEDGASVIFTNDGDDTDSNTIVLKNVDPEDITLRRFGSTLYVVKDGTDLMATIYDHFTWVGDPGEEGVAAIQFDANGDGTVESGDTINVTDLDSSELTRINAHEAAGWHENYLVWFGVTATWWDPLVIDLNGSGFGGYERSEGIQFDLDGNGFAEQTGWIAPGEGFLARDLNDNGQIDNGTELFGDATTNGFAALAAFDENSDGVVNSSDSVWSDLIIWKDLNSDAYTQSDELFTLASLDITGIDVANYTTGSGGVSGGFSITHTGTVTTTTGTIDAANVNFSVDQIDTRYALDYDFDARAAFLPNIRGYYNAPELSIALSIDNDEEDPDSIMSLFLSAFSRDFTDFFESYDDVREDLKAALFRWTGVDDVSPTSRGDYIDAREIGFIEAVLAQGFVDAHFTSGDPGAVQARDIHDLFEDVFGRLLGNMLAQTFFVSLFEEGLAYDVESDLVTGNPALSEDSLDLLESHATGLGSTEERLDFWVNVTTFLTDLRTARNSGGSVYGLSSGDEDLLEAAIEASDGDLTWYVENHNPGGGVTSVEYRYQNPVGETFTGTSGADNLDGTNNADTMTGAAGADDLFGGIGNDKLYGHNEDGSGDDAANDILDGGEGDDDLHGGAGNDTLTGGLGNDHLVGGDGNDTLNDGSGTGAANRQNLLEGGAGNDNYIVAAPTDGGRVYIVDPEGTDRITFLNNPKFVLSDLSIKRLLNDHIVIQCIKPTANFLLTIDDMLTELDDSEGAGIETIRLYTHAGMTGAAYWFDLKQHLLNWSGSMDTIGTEFADTIYGITFGNEVDDIDARGGDDTIYAGNGDDYIDGGSGNDTLHGEAGADILLGGNSHDILFGGDGDDDLYGNAGNDQIYGGAGADYLIGDTGDNILDGGDGNDALTSSSGDDTFVFSSGNDTYLTFDGFDVIQMTADILPENVAFSSTTNDVILTVSGPVSGQATILNYKADNEYRIDQISFADGFSLDFSDYNSITFDSNSSPTSDETLSDAAGAVFPIIGRGGTDRIYGRDSITGDTLSGGADNDFLYGGTGDDLLHGGSGTDELYGEEDDDHLWGSVGDDLLDGGSGDDIIDGGEGTDTVSYAADTAGVTVNLGASEAIDGSSDDDTLVAIENILGSAYVDTLTGDDVANVIDGGAGNDTIDGGDGDDAITGGAGVDDLQGGEGSDFYNGAGDVISDADGALDYIVFGAGINPEDLIVDGDDTDLLIDYGTGDIIIANQLDEEDTNQIEFARFADGTELDLLRYSDWAFGTSSNNTMNGTSGDDIFIGLAGDDTVTGGNGDDILWGGDGDDTLDGGDGNNLLFGGAGNDVLSGLVDPSHYEGGTGDDLYNVGWNPLHTMYDSGGSADVLTSGHPGSFTDFSFEQIGDDLVIESTAPVDWWNPPRYWGVTILDQFKEGNAIETFEVAGMVLDLASFSDWVWLGDAGGTESGTAALDTIIGGDGDDTASGGDEDDLLFGGDGNDTLNGGDGNDTIIGSYGNDTYDGGDGDDLLTEWEEDSGDDTITGGAGNDYINGYYGNDVLTGGLGDDSVGGEEGDDTYFYSLGDGSDNWWDFDGTDRIFFGPGIAPEDLIFTDVVDGWDNHVEITFDGAAGTDKILLQNFNDDPTYQIEFVQFDSGLILDLPNHENWLIGTSGNDTLDGDTGNDTIYGGDGNDTLSGDDGDDYLYADDGDDTANGGDGDDTIIAGGGAGNDTYNGGNDTDTLTYTSTTAGITVNLAAGSNHATGSEIGTDQISGVENVTGGSGNDSLTGDSNDNELLGGAGNDTLKGAAGNDTLDGGSGTDTADYSSAAAAVTASLASGTASNDGDSGSDTLTEIENVTGSAYADTITGSTGANVLSGGAGADSLSGGDGNDTLKGGSGNDTLDGGNDSDIADYSGAGAAVTVSLASGTASNDGDSGSDTLSNIENVTGSAYNDTITGSTGNNVLNGGSAGNDTINAGDGNDIYAYTGGTGTDVFSGENGTDTADFSGFGSAVWVNINNANNDAQTRDNVNLSSGTWRVIATLHTTENVIGTSLPDEIYGNSESNVFAGGGGNDLLEAKGGDDEYVFNIGDGEDTIDDTSGTDTLRFGAGIEASDLIFSYVGGDDLQIAFTGSSDKITIVNHSGGTPRPVEKIVFADASELYLAKTITGTSGADTITGTVGPDTINGSGGNDIVNPLSGTDTINAGDGDDKYVYTGAITMGLDTFNGDAGLDTADLSSFGSAVWVDLGNTTNDVQTRDNVNLSSGTWRIIATLHTTENVIGTSRPDELYGNTEANVLTGGGGNDILQGKAGNDEYVFNAGDGEDTIDDTSGTDILRFGAGIDASDLIFSYVGGDDLQITFTGSSDKITIVNHDAGGTKIIEKIVFADASELDLAATINGTADLDNIVGTFGPDTLNGGDSDDILTPMQGTDTVNGENGNDTFVYTDGFDVFDGGADVDTADLSGFGYAVWVDLSAASNDVKTRDYVDLSTGTWRNLATLTNTENAIGSGFHDEMSGNSGDNMLVGGAGNDTLSGATGNDTYVYSEGLDVVTDTGGTDVLWIEGGVTINDISFSDVSTNDTKITVNASTDEITVINLRHGTSTHHVDTIMFDDGFYANLPSYASATWLNGTSGNDLISANGSDNTLVGFAGNDDMDAGAGNDNAHGGDGDDTIEGGDGDDLLYGGADDDVLFGGDGLDTIVGGDGEDTFVFEDASAFNDIDVIRDFTPDDDVLDLIDIMAATAFDPEQDAIEDWIAMTSDDSDTLLQVDRDGTGGTYAMETIVRLEGINLSDEAELVANGSLLLAA